MTRNPDKRFTVKVGLEVRMFLEDEHKRLRKEKLRETGELGETTYQETVRTLIAELEHYREECTCLDRPGPEELRPLSQVRDP